ncbi:SNF2 domain-containing protein ENL1 isoform X2 [Magnolia sinica]|uniref:SNF2 domain-containing protein ENL1 isoform X2 n=1 Tax=Magnolia sinica TaxID=86752 RepID=UPI00265B2DE0|nr:SNF2 domain-containing protein ENL1 isoform X2 [Magnolia sinica]
MSKSKPLSLNERNERLLGDFPSQSRSSKAAPHLFPAVKKSVKVKLQGRRRLCKFSSNPTEEDEEESNGLMDSPPQIRDILNDLSSRLETLSIEKKRIPQTPMSSFSLLSDSDYAASHSPNPSLQPTPTNISDTTAEVKESVAVSSLHSPLGSEDEEDCVILSGKGLDKEAVLGDDGRNAVWVDDVEDSVSEDGDSITLSGPLLTYTLPGRIAKMLYPHQRDGLNWLWSIHCRRTGGILGDDMGLGKTMQVSAFLAGLFHSDLIKRALIVAPKTLLAHWIKELSVVGLSEKIREYYGTSVKTRQYELQYVLQDKGVLLTTYDIGHIIKNPNTQRAKSLTEIPSIHRIIISGTPIQNNLKELWALFNFCCPEILGDKKEFRERYEHAILRGNDKNASEREKRVGSTVAKELRERIKPYFLRRLKSEVFLENEGTKSAKLSKKHEMIVWLRLTPCQRRLYEAFLKSELVHSSFNGSPLAALTVLKKICDHPLLLTKKAAEGVLEGMDAMLNHKELGMVEKMALHLANMTGPEETHQVHDNVSCKITFIVSLLENLVTAGHNVLIFSQTRKMLNLIQEAILSKGYTFLRIDGTTKAFDREKIVNDFQEGKGASIFLLTSQVGGLGLTLTKADRVIVVDPAWNPSTDNQSVDRAYRIGQNKDVLVYRLMTCGTIEEKIYKMQVFKGGLFKTATEHKEQTRYFSKRDLQELFSLPEQGFDISLTQQQLHEEHDCQHKMEDSLKSHIKFLESQGIAGVSHHSLLFSKTKPVQLVQEDERVAREMGAMRVGPSSSLSSLERDVDGAKYAFNPKDKQQWRIETESALKEAKAEEIKKRIERMGQTLANKALVSKLPDKGEKIQRQIVELNLELDKISKSQSRAEEVIDLDDISGRFERLRTD